MCHQVPVVDDDEFNQADSDDDDDEFKMFSAGTKDSYLDESGQIHQVGSYCS